MSTTEQVSTEAIQYQGKSPFFLQLTAAMETVLASEKNYTHVKTATLNSVEIEKIIKEHTGLPLLVVVDKDNEYNMYVEFPLVDLSNPLLIRFKNYIKGGYFGVKDQQKALKQTKLDSGVYRSAIDLKTGRVSGGLENFRSTIHIPFRMFDGKMTAAELAGVVLHEVGHVFTYIEKFLSVTSDNVTLLTAWDEFANTQDQVQKIKIIDEVFHDLQITRMNAEAIADIKSQDEFHTVILTGKYQEVRSNLSSGAYDNRASEISADQFAIRHGAGKDLMIALDKMGRHYGLGNYRSATVNNLMSGLFMAVVTGISIAVPFLGIYLVLVLLGVMATPGLDVEDYDDPAERIDRAIHDMTQSLKSPKLSLAQAHQLAEEIKTLQMIRHTVRANSSLVMLVWRNMTARRRDQHKQKIFQRELETLVNNRLYVHSILLNNLATK